MSPVGRALCAVAGMSNLSMTSDSVLRCTSMCTRAAEYFFNKLSKEIRKAAEARCLSLQVARSFRVRYTCNQLEELGV